MLTAKTLCKISLIISVIPLSMIAAADQLGKTQVEELLANKTVVGYDVDKGYKYRAFFNANGVVVLQRKQYRFYGTWRVDPVGRHCMRKTPSAREVCAYIEKMGAGIYRKMRDGEHTHTYRSILKGSQI